MLNSLQYHFAVMGLIYISDIGNGFTTDSQRNYNEPTLAQVSVTTPPWGGEGGRSPSLGRVGVGLYFCLQSYNILIAVHECFAIFLSKNFFYGWIRWHILFCSLLQPWLRRGFRRSAELKQAPTLHSLLQRCSVAVLKMLPPIPKNTSIFIYIYIYLYIYRYRVCFDFLVVVVLELQHCNTVTHRSIVLSFPKKGWLFSGLDF